MLIKCKSKKCSRPTRKLTTFGASGALERLHQQLGALLANHGGFGKRFRGQGAALFHVPIHHFTRRCVEDMFCRGRLELWKLSH